ncbi:hypothetical protein HYV44_01830 [Candidatus Microgenomates bacterium]|nr:hypothetical protein [Candidatus Microgenomates bacterium]
MLILKKNKCLDCGPLKTSHFLQWVEDILAILPSGRVFLPARQKYFFNNLIDRAFLFLGLTRLSDNLENEQISLRSRVFFREALKKNIKIWAIKSSYGPINQFLMEVGGKKHTFEGLPRADFLHQKISFRVDDKAVVKKILEQNGIPSAFGRSFGFWQARKALEWADSQKIYPCVVKPRFGSMSQHVSLNIKNKESLKSAIKKALQYSPFFILEKFITNAFTYRATIVDQKFVACVKRLPAHIVGDGEKSIKELVEEKNQDPLRGNAGDKHCATFKIVIDETSHKLFKEKKYTLKTIPASGERVFLQEKVILDIGADLEETTKTVHPDNYELFCRVAKIFGVYLVGVDFLGEDIKKSWREQNGAVLELNSLPYIDMHHYPTKGEPANIGEALATMVESRYK